MTTTASAICTASASSQRPHRAPACRVNVQLTSTSALQRGMLPYFAFRPWRLHRLEANSISFPMVYCETCGSAEKLVKNGSKSVVNSTILFAFLQPMSVAAKLSAVVSSVSCRFESFCVLNSHTVSWRSVCSNVLNFAVKALKFKCELHC